MDNVSAPKGVERLGQPANSNISNTIAVMSGKGGVGKSSVAALLAAQLARRGLKVGLLDADVTGPSIPKLFGLKGSPVTLAGQIVPPVTRTGVRVMSLNLLLEHEDDPVIWRGPLIAGAVKQFWTDVLWGDLDYMIVDLPPGTGDVPLTVLQSLPVDGVVIVTSPQDLSRMVVRKAVNMVTTMNVPVLGIVQNMAWIKCPHCGERIEPFGHTTADETAREMSLELVGSLPIDPAISELGDSGLIEDYRSDECLSIAGRVESVLAAHSEH